jgi:hypothetical protein
VQLKFEMSLRDKQRFFDREAVRQSLEPAFASYLLQSGALVRKITQRSIRRGGKRRKPSDPGKPPKHHLPGSNEGLRRIIFTLSKDNMHADIGPVKYERAKAPSIPALHEFGGLSPGMRRVVAPMFNTQWMFKPANVAKYPELHKKIQRLAHMPNPRRFRIEFDDGQVFTAQDFIIKTESVIVKMPPRPFMAPALSAPATQKQLEQIWAKTIQKTIKQGIRWSKSSGR